MKKTFAFLFLFLFPSSLAIAKYYCISYQGINFSISIPDDKKLRDIAIISGSHLHFQEIAILFSNDTTFPHQGIEIALSLLAHLLENDIPIIEELAPLNVLDSNTVSFLHPTYPEVSVNSYGVTTLINPSQNLSFRPLESLITTSITDAENDIKSLEDSDSYFQSCEPDVTVNYRCLYGCNKEVFDSTWSRSKHHKKRHFDTLNKVKGLVRDGLNCPKCGKKIITYNQLAQHLRFHNFKSYFRFLDKHLQ